MGYTFDRYLNAELVAETAALMSDSELRDLIGELASAFNNETITGAAFVGRNLATAITEVLITGRKVKVIWTQDQLPGLRASDKKRK